MAVSTAAQLTQQFYEWEQRGRGWYKADFVVDLEPPFEPFFGHALPERPIIDDGRRPSFFQLLFNAGPKPIESIPPVEEEIKAYPCTDESLFVVFSVAISRNSSAQAEHMEQLLIMLLYCNSPVTFELIATSDDITFQLTCRESFSSYVEAQVKAFFPNLGIQVASVDRIQALWKAELCLYTIDFGLSDEFMCPLVQMSGNKENLVPFYGILDRLRGAESVVVQILFQGLRHNWSEQLLHAVYDNDGKSSFFFDAPEMVGYAREKVSRPLCAATIRTIAFADTLPAALSLLGHVTTTLGHSVKGTSNALLPLLDESYPALERMEDVLMRQSHRLGMLLSSKELTALAHFPLVPLRKSTLQRNTNSVPSTLLNHDYRVGRNEHQGIESNVTLSEEQRSRHMHIIGSTGTGKSTLLHSLMMQDVELGNGFMCLDPHGDLIEELLRTVPQERVNDIVLIDPSDSEFPIGLNILLAHSELEKELLASDLVAIFRRFSTSWGDQMNSVFANAILAFLYNTKTGTLADLRRFLIEANYRNETLATVTDQDIAYYWRHEYPLLKGTSIGSILTRLDGFLRPRVIRNMVSQKHSLDFAGLMDGKKIILVKLSQGLLGAENSFLLGAFIVSKLQQIAMSRQAQAKGSRVPFYCYIDEFHQFITPSMAEILSGARKYGLGLVLAHQDMQQVQKTDKDIATSLLSAGTRICLRLGDADARRLQDGFASFRADDLQNLGTGEAIIRVNTASNDCSMDVIPYSVDHESNKEAIIANSRAKYCGGKAKENPTSHSVDNQPETPEPEPVTHVTTFSGADLQSRESMREHRYLQSFIKKMAEDHGYKAQLEVKTPDGKGQVDVLLEKEGKSVAVEISVSTNAAWELHNIRKCLAAQYSSVIVCTNAASKTERIKAKIDAVLTASERSKVRVITAGEMPALFVTEPRPAPATMKGYRVKVTYEQSRSANSEAILQRIASLKK